uniref:Uncharacterized protein n=1 Tax=Anguilla anguilla TaxID=7936 RepID=A0A0E9VAI3_ANGAN
MESVNSGSDGITLGGYRYQLSLAPRSNPAREASRVN